MISVNPNYAQSEKLFIENQRISSLWYLSFWSHPAWFCGTKHSSLSRVATKEWVAFHRLSIAQDKETLAQIMGSVKKVIPNSKLAKYGDFSYDINYEEMCCIAEDVSIKPQVLKAENYAYAKRYNFWASETEISDSKDNDLYLAHSINNLSDLTRSIRSLGEWLEVLNRVLIRVRRIANKAQLLDLWTDTLLKFCLRLVCILRINESFAKILNSEISFIVDYKQLQKIPISKIELLSIPESENESDIFLDNKSVDALWLKLSSSKIRKIWNKDTRVPFLFDSEDQHNKHLINMMKTNFLRRRQSKDVDSLRQTIDIPKNMEIELLGSFLHIINKNSLESVATLTKLDCVSRSHFPEAHGELTKQIFPHSLNLNQTFEKDFVIQKPWNAASLSQVSDSAIKLQHGCSETTTMPLQFYKSVPPPTLSAHFRPPYMHCQPRNKLVFMAPNSLIPNPPNQQMQCTVPAAPISSVLPVTYISQASFYQNCIAPRLSAPIQADVAGQHHRLNFLRPHYQYYNFQNTKELQKYQSKVDEHFIPERTSIESEAKDLNEEKQVCNNPEGTRALTNIPTATFIQLNRGYNIPFRMQHTINTAQPSMPNPQLLGSRMPLKMNYPITSYRLRIPLIKNKVSPQNQCILPQFTTKPQFLGPITIDNIKRMNEKLFQQRHQLNYINGPSCQDIKKSPSSEKMPLHLKDTCHGYENKVEKWLESINKYAEIGPFIKLEELPELLNEFSDDHNKLEIGERGDNTELGQRQSKNTSEVLQAKSSRDVIKSLPTIPNSIDGNSRKNKMNIMQRKKLKSKSCFYEHLHLFRTIEAELNNCKNLRRKIKIVETYFAGVNSIRTKRFCFENLNKILRMKNHPFKKVGQRKKKELLSFKQEHSLATKPNQKLSTENNFDMHQSILFITDISKYKVAIRESQEFNAFPSKRAKLSNSQPSFFKTQGLIRDERGLWISSLKYFDSVIDELFFGANGIEEIHGEKQNKGMKAEENGWFHFKVAVKMVMKNVISSLDAQI